MNHSLFHIPEWAFYLAYLIFAVAVILGLVQFLRSQNIFEKVLALELMTAIVMCFVITFAIESSQVFFLEISLCIASVAFLGTVAFSRYLKRTQKL